MTNLQTVSSTSPPTAPPMSTASASSTGPVVKSTFLSAGVACAATLRVPAGEAPPSGWPAILMVHGWGGTQDALTPNFYRRFNAAGFAVLTFDYPGWGDSAGWPRHHIWASGRVRNADDALAHLKSLPQMDKRRIVLWGTSLGGGHVVDLAAAHPELLGAIAQVPMLDGQAAALANPPARMLRFFLCALADVLRPGGRFYVPIVAPRGQFATMERDGAFDTIERAQAELGQRYHNVITASSTLSMGLYRPFKRLGNIRVPTLLIGGLRDTVAPFVEKKVRAVNNDCLRIATLDVNHFEPYWDAPFEKNIELQLRFLNDLAHGA